jgi:hypothetical protein
MSALLADDLYIERRGRIAIQAVEIWTDGARGLDDGSETEAFRVVTAAADRAFHSNLNDLDWIEATLRLLEKEQAA